MDEKAGMARAIALHAQTLFQVPAPEPVEIIRKIAVWGCALVLIAAGPVLSL